MISIMTIILSVLALTAMAVQLLSDSLGSFTNSKPFIGMWYLIAVLGYIYSVVELVKYLFENI